MKVKTNIVLGVCIAFLITIFPHFTYAQSPEAYVTVNPINYKTDEIRIGGAHPKGEGREVTVSVTLEGHTQPFYWNGKATGKDGKFEFIYTVKKDVDEGGWYTVLMGGLGLSPISLEYLLINSNDDSVVTGSINNANDTTMIEVVLNEYGNNIGIRRGEGTLFDSMSSEEQQQIYDALLKRNFDNALEISKAFSDATIIQMLNKSEISDGSDIVNNYAEYLDLDVNDESYYTSVKTQANKNKVYAAIIGRGFPLTDLTAAKTAFERASALAAVNDMGVSNRDKMIEYIEDFNNRDYFTTSLTLYKSSLFNAVDRLNIIQKVIDKKDVKPFSSFQDFKLAFETSVTEVSKTKEKKGNTPSGGGGGRPIISIVSDTETNAEPEKEEILFNDIQHVQWAVESINFLAKKNIISGTGNNSFEPDRGVYREEFVKMLVVSLGLEQLSADTDFIDVEKDAWYHQYISVAHLKGFVQGIDNEHFGVGEVVSREQLCTMVYRAIQKLNINLELKRDSKEFADKEDISLYAQEAVDYLYRADIISGVSENSFAPKEKSTRAMTARIIYNVLERSGLQ